MNSNELPSTGALQTGSGANSCSTGCPARHTFYFFLISLALVFGSFTVGRKVNVDENVFVASAALLARQSALIYRDFHYNHMPTLVLIYAALFKVTDYFLLAARSVSALCAAGAAAIFFDVAYKTFAFLNARRRMVFALGVGLLYLCNPLFTRTAGRAWNHDFPVLMSLLGFLALNAGLEKKCLLRLAASGLFVSLAVTSRLTFATELLPFCLFILIYPNVSLPDRIRLFAAFTIGGVIALLPSAYVWAQSPANAYFGNFQYPAFNTEWHFLHDNQSHHRYALLTKIGFFLFNICIEMPGNGVIFFTSVALFCRLVPRWRDMLKDARHSRLLIVAVLAASQLAAGLVPSPPFFQYFYAATPFLLLFVIYAFAELPHTITLNKNNWVWLGCLVLTFGFAVPEYRDLPYLFWPPAWWPVQAHRAGIAIAKVTAESKAAGRVQVLTLDPIYVLEGGVPIYPELATGPFGIRVGDYLTRQQRTTYKMWGRDDIRNLFDHHPPPAMMISAGSDGEIEALFIKQAESHGYRRVEVNKKNPSIVVWEAPN